MVKGSFGYGAAAALLAALALSGCKTVKDARSLQEQYAAYTNDNRAAGVRLELDFRKATLTECASFALDCRPEMENAQMALWRAEIGMRTAAADRMPNLSAVGGYSQSTANRGESFSWRQERGAATFGLEFDWLIYDFGRTDAKEREARENLAAAALALCETGYTVCEEVAQSYFGVLRDKALLEVARTNEYVYAEHLRNAESRFSAGEVRKLDVLKARVDATAARLQTIAASNTVVQAEAKFILALGLESDLVDRALAVPAAGPVEPIVPAMPASHYSAAAAMDVARTNSPAIKAARARLRAAYAQVDWAIADLYPKVTLSSAFSFADPSWNWRWGVNAVMSLLDGWRKECAVAQAMAGLREARAALDQLEQQRAHDLDVAVAARDNARDSLAAAEIETAQAKENLQTVSEQYAVGDASRLDFTDAAGTLAAALGAKVKAFYALEIAEANLIKLTGAGFRPAKAGEAEQEGEQTE